MTIKEYNELQNAPFFMDINQFADMRDDEFASLNGVRIPEILVE